MSQPVATVPEPSWYQRLYRKMEALSATPHAFWAMIAVAVVDASFFPVPPFALLVPMVLAQPKRWWSLALWGTIASVFGGLLGYYLGHLIHQGFAQGLAINLDAPIHFHHLGLKIDASVGELLKQNLWFLILCCTILPTPFKIVAIGCGMVSVPLPTFLLAAAIGRTMRFFGIAGALAIVGPSARKWLRV